MKDSRSRQGRSGLVLLWVGVWCAASASAAQPAQQDTAAPASPVVVSAYTDVERVPIGKPFRYTVEVHAPSGFELVVPVLGGQLGDFYITDFGDEPTREAANRMTVTRWYTMVAYEPGLHFIPGLTVQYRPPGGELARVDGEDVAVQVLSLLEKGPEASDIKDIKPPVSVPFDWTPVLWGGAALVVLAGLGLLGARIVRRINAPATAAPPPPPDVVALEALARLRQRRLDDPEARSLWFVAVSSIVRQYIEGRFGVRAPEMTTEEFIVAVQRDSPLSPDHRQLLAHFLSECDLVKFAGVRPDLEAAERVYDAARRFVNESRPAAAPEETARAA